MRALSLTQPMAWAIFNGKDVENRTWPTKFRGRVYIHASKGFNREHYDWIWQQADRFGLKVPLPAYLVHGAIIGQVDIVDCVTESNSPWFFGPYGFVLENPVLHEQPIPYKGRLGIFEVTLSRYFLTVDWCSQGHRGIFCSREGNAFPKDGQPHTEHEMWEILGVFDLVLHPQSIQFTDEEVKEFTRWYPLGEYKEQYGYALKPVAKEAEPALH